MLWVIRIGLVLGAVLVIRPAARILAVLFVADLSEPGILPEIGMGIVLLVGLVALLVSAADRLVSSTWLAVFSAIGFASIGLTRLNTSCSEASFAGPSYESYLCASPTMIVGVAAISLLFLLIVAFRKLGLLPRPELHG